MSLIRAVAVSLVIFTVTAPSGRAQQAVDPVGDPERGKVVYRSVGMCQSCHGWPADGRTGVNLRSPTGSNLRETELSRDELIHVIACGRPGTAMPFHDRTAYDDGRCDGLALSDFASGDEPKRGKTLRDRDIANVVAYLQSHVIGLGKPTFEECVTYFDNRAAKACTYLK